MVEQLRYREQGRKSEVKKPHTWGKIKTIPVLLITDSFDLWKANKHLKWMTRVTNSESSIGDDSLQTCRSSFHFSTNTILRGRNNFMNQLCKHCLQLMSAHHHKWMWRWEEEAFQPPHPPLPLVPPRTTEGLPQTPYLLSVFSKGCASLCSLDTASLFPRLAA